jgi:hypothetical protein
MRRSDLSSGHGQGHDCTSSPLFVDELEDTKPKTARDEIISPSFYSKITGLQLWLWDGRSDIDIEFDNFSSH